MTVKYKKSVGIILIVLGLLVNCLYLSIALGGGKISTPPIGNFLIILLGVLILTRKYFEYDENSLTIHAILGPVKTIYTFNSLKEIELDGKRLSIMQGDARKKISISLWMVNKENWQTFLKKITVKNR